MDEGENGAFNWKFKTKMFGIARPIIFYLHTHKLYEYLDFPFHQTKHDELKIYKNSTLEKYTSSFKEIAPAFFSTSISTILLTFKQKTIIIKNKNNTNQTLVNSFPIAHDWDLNDFSMS